MQLNKKFPSNNEKEIREKISGFFFLNEIFYLFFDKMNLYVQVKKLDATKGEIRCEQIG